LAPGPAVAAVACAAWRTSGLARSKASRNSCTSGITAHHFCQDEVRVAGRNKRRNISFDTKKKICNIRAAQETLVSSLERSISGVRRAKRH
jgi:hypothetical protein